MKSNRGKMTEGVPLAMIIKREIRPAPEIVMLSAPRSIQAERFRRLKTTLVHTSGDQVQALVVTSGLPGEGKSTVSLNLALAFASESGSRTLLVDGDLRRPSVGLTLHPAPQLGVTEVLTGKADLVHAIVHLSNCPLHVLPAGSPTKEPHELLASEDAKDLFRTLRERYDRIIVDSPPIVLFTDADSLGALCDGMIVVARAGVTPKSAFTQAISAVTSTRILGSVLNSASKSHTRGKNYYESYHEYYENDRKS